MNAIDIMVKRLNEEIDDDTACFYVKMAETKIRSYLKLVDDADLSQYLLSVVDLAILYYQKDKSIQHVSDTAGFKSESFSEGGVSESRSGMTSADINIQYDNAIADLLSQLDSDLGTVIFL